MDTYEKKIREYLNNGEVDELYKNMLLNLFPELKESEDEKIRKMIINHLTQERGSLSNDEAAKAISWLEKQGEKKSQRMISAEAKEAMYDKPAWSEENEVRINRIVACLENLNVADNDILLKDVNWLKSLKRIEGE